MRVNSRKRRAPRNEEWTQQRADYVECTLQFPLNMTGMLICAFNPRCRRKSMAQHKTLASWGWYALKLMHELALQQRGAGRRNHQFSSSAFT